MVRLPSAEAERRDIDCCPRCEGCDIDLNDFHIRANEVTLYLQCEECATEYEVDVKSVAWRIPDDCPVY